MSNQVDTCLKKTPYRNKRIADRQARHMTKTFGVWHKSYECPICYYWHTTTYGFVGQPSINKPIREDYLNE